MTNTIYEDRYHITSKKIDNMERTLGQMITFNGCPVLTSCKLLIKNRIKDKSIREQMIKDYDFLNYLVTEAKNKLYF